jgi:dCMP deaminase
MKKNWDITFLQIANIVSEHSTCTRVQVGGVLVKGGRIISTGYNGVASKQFECKQFFKELHKEMNIEETFEEFIKSKEFSEMHRDFSIHNEIHAEQNIIGYAARNGVNTEGSTIYLTCSPCMQCAKLLVASGVVRVVYPELYNRKEDDGIPLLKQCGIKCDLIENKS